MKNLKKLIHLLFFIVFLTSCKTSVNKEELIINSEDQKSDQINTAKSQMELKYSYCYSQQQLNLVQLFLLLQLLVQQMFFC